MDDLHILTSTKGGVGKTLISLCTVLHYYKSGRPLLGIDLNAMNPDFFRILSFNDVRPISHLDWEKSEISAKGIGVVRPAKPRSLPDGAIGFWRRLDEIVQNSDFRGCDFLVDTNVHIANLVQAEETRSPLEVIDQILVRVKRIYIWVIWSWASFQEITPIYSSFDTLSHRFGDRVSVVHVLNPSAITPPQTELMTRSQFIVAVAHAISGLKELTSYLGEEDSAQFLIQAVQKLNSKRNSAKREDGFRVDGLYELSQAKPTKPMNLTEFRSVTEEITKRLRENSPTDLSLFVPVNEAIQRILLGVAFDDDSFNITSLQVKDMRRPSNILAIGTHDMRLTGYTDKFARSPTYSISGIVDEIAPSVRETVSRFLDNLAPVLPIEKTDDETH